MTQKQSNLRTRLSQVVALVVVFGTYYMTLRATPNAPSNMTSIAAVGLLLIGSTLAGQLLEPIGVPHLTAYLAVGIVAGPYVLHLVDRDQVGSLSSINTLALSLIAFAGGAELKLDLIRRSLKSLAVATILQQIGVAVAMGALFVLVRPLVPFARGLSLSGLVGVAILWGVIASTRSPAGTLGILAQTRAKGRLTDFSVAFVMTSDVVVVVLAAAAMALARPLVDPGGTFALDDFKKLGHELLGSVSLGTTLGLLIVLYLKYVEKQFLLVLLILGFGFTEVLHYLGFDPLLTFLMAGFLVQNLSKQGEKFLHHIEDTGSVVYVLFFATAGADINLPLLRDMWKVALLLVGSRCLATIVANAVGGRLAKEPVVLRRWGWSGLVSQAGVALGIALLIANSFPQFGSGLRSLALASVALNQLVGPVLFKLALDRAGETASSPERSRREPTPAV